MVPTVMQIEYCHANSTTLCSLQTGYTVSVSIYIVRTLITFELGWVLRKWGTLYSSVCVCVWLRRKEIEHKPKEKGCLYEGTILHGCLVIALLHTSHLTPQEESKASQPNKVNLSLSLSLSHTHTHLFLYLLYIY